MVASPFLGIVQECFTASVSVGQSMTGVDLRRVGKGVSVAVFSSVPTAIL